MACSASGSQLPELKASLKRLQGRKDAELEKEQGTRDRELLRGLKIDLDRVQAAITAQSFGELHLLVSTSASHAFGIVWPHFTHDIEQCTHSQHSDSQTFVWLMQRLLVTCTLLSQFGSCQVIWHTWYCALPFQRALQRSQTFVFAFVNCLSPHLSPLACCKLDVFLLCLCSQDRSSAHFCRKP